MPKMSISRSVQIEAEPSKVYQVLSDFNEWIPWSPWLLMEPEANVSVAEDGRSYKWEGDRVGSGHMKILEEKENEHIEYDLTFLKPWKSQAITAFSLEKKGDQTHVTWTMNSKLPFFLFWMKKSMEAFVGADYERGLDMLKAYCETGKVPSKLSFVGTQKYAGCQWIGVDRTCSIEETETVMETDFAKLAAEAGKNSDNLAGDMMTIYHKWDIPKNQVSYTAAMPVKSVPDEIPAGFTQGQIPAVDAYVIQHVGRYQHLGNAWSTLYTMIRNKELKHQKSVHPFEIYRNNPSDTPESELITEVYMPVKS